MESKNGSHKNELDQNYVQKMWLLIFTLWHKKYNKVIWNKYMQNK